ncbi:PREDICTED: cadherin-related family member 4 [Gekko japonicus]|uniref:Cadherin-related family member 4 n=1 Tax=Gekko japonicus TaxID=146911 RepID=A0ABM1JN23_GEKJA|nr:PREDICTED: cadherin-related family member 4 [Gekko japonicus]
MAPGAALASPGITWLHFPIGCLSTSPSKRRLLSPTNLGDCTFQQIVKAVQNHFAPKPTELTCRVTFYTRNQLAGETAAEFLAELRQLAADCNFGAHLEDALRDHFVVDNICYDLCQKMDRGNATLLILLDFSVDFSTINHEFDDLPRTVEVDENMTAGVVASFTVNCTTPSSNGLTVTLETISPTTTFFNSPNALGNGTFQVTLRPGTDLNAREVNQYTLTFKAACPGEDSVTSQLYIQVKEVDRLECDNTFINTAARPLLVPENVAPETVIYTVTLKRRGRGSLTFAFENGSVPFTLNAIGEVLAPATGLTRTQAGKLFQMNIVVSDGDGRSCRSLLMVQVQPVYHNTVNFTESSKAVSVFENTGPLQTITQVHAHGEGHVLYEIIFPSTVYFTIGSETGEIKNTYNIDLDRNPELAQTLLVVRAYDMLHPSDSATITVNITVQPRNLQGPVCQPAIYVAEIPEDSPTGMSLTALSCVDKERNRTLQYQMETSQIPPGSFRMERNVLQVNTTLDCDSVAMASLGFQYRATILVTDSGSPQQTTRIPVLVTVSRVNEYQPECPQRFSFSIPEDAAFGDFVANVNGTDRDYPFNNIEYSILGAQNVFYIGRRSGNLYVLGPLDYEEQKSYPLTINLKDLDNDVNPQAQHIKQCNITINVQNVNDQAPVCTPEIETRTIYSTLASTTNIMTLQCHDDEEGSQLSYAIVGGNINGRFYMNDNRLFHNTFSYNRDGIFDPLNFELLVEVTDSRSTPRLSTTATIIVHVIPWTTTVPTTAAVTTMQHHFDGSAQDPVTGQYYLYDSSSGARRWM